MDFPVMETLDTAPVKTKSGHIIIDNSSKFKDTIIVILIIVIVVLLLIQFSK